MTDIVERLQYYTPYGPITDMQADAIMKEAADEIERLRAALRSICNCSTKMDYKKTSDRLDQTYKIARKALGEKK